MSLEFSSPKSQGTARFTFHCWIQQWRVEDHRHFILRGADDDVRVEHAKDWRLEECVTQPGLTHTPCPQHTHTLSPALHTSLGVRAATLSSHCDPFLHWEPGEDGECRSSGLAEKGDPEGQGDGDGT